MKALFLVFAMMFSLRTFAAIDPVTRLQNGPKSSVLSTWTGITSAGTAASAPAAFKGANYVEHELQVEGTFAGATVVMQGSNDGTTFYTLLDPANVGVSFTAAGLKKVKQAPLYLKPLITGGTSATLINAILHSK